MTEPNKAPDKRRETPDRSRDKEAKEGRKDKVKYEKEDVEEAPPVGEQEDVNER